MDFIFFGRIFAKFGGFLQMLADFDGFWSFWLIVVDFDLMLIDFDAFSWIVSWILMDFNRS